MSRGIPFGTKQLIGQLRDHGFSIVEITRITDVSYTTAQFYAKAQERGFASRADYERQLAERRGFESLTKYREHLAQESGFESLADYAKQLAKGRGFESLTDYAKQLAKGRGFVSLTEYHRHLAQERQQRLLNQRFSAFLRQRLTELERTQEWLSEQLGITQRAVSGYASGESLPRRSLRKKLFVVLELPDLTLDDLLEQDS